MSSVAVAVLFVIGALYVRRQYGGAALAALTVATAGLMSLVSAGGFLTALRAFGASASTTANAVVVGMLVVSQAISYGCAALAVHLVRKDDGPWLSGSGFWFGMLGYVAGGVLAALIAVAAILAGAMGMAK